MKSVVALFSSLSAVALAQGEAPVQVPGTAPAVAGASGAPSGMMNLILLGGAFLFMWLFVLRPQAKKQKEHKKFLETLQNGQDIVTSGGLVGKIISVSDSIVTLDLGTSSVKILRSAVSASMPAAQS